ncbi:MAG: phosphoribosylanthranilate isomerase [Cyclobacteriaceae bacterium]|nr:phosphoribosylanthranilate isomerase [Cyclobacteriaceae bacterium]MCH8516965.1 phosphoribosylanthranilate isomerase [Cyclobacteriaceae bacterium]
MMEELNYVKVCGMSDLGNTEELLELSPNAVGFIFYPFSKRFVGFSPHWIKQIEDPDVDKVGVFVNESVESILHKVKLFGLHVVQLHGDESKAECLELSEKGIEVWKAIPIAKEHDFKRTKDYEGVVDCFVFDTKGNERGGNGEKFDWDLLSNYKGNTPFLLSGGIGSEDVERIKTVSHPQFKGIDLNSKFEISPGLKDVDELEAFFIDLFDEE